MDLKRCFGVDKKVSECDWSYLQTLRTVRAPHEPIPSLEELLAFLAEYEQQDMWLILDIKVTPLSETWVHQLLGVSDGVTRPTTTQRTL